jgi:hypothetical protein
MTGLGPVTNDLTMLEQIVVDGRAERGRDDGKEFAISTPEFRELRKSVICTLARSKTQAGCFERPSP